MERVCSHVASAGPVLSSTEIPHFICFRNTYDTQTHVFYLFITFTLSH